MGSNDQNKGKAYLADRLSEADPSYQIDEDAFNRALECLGPGVEHFLIDLLKGGTMLVAKGDDSGQKIKKTELLAGLDKFIETCNIFSEQSDRILVLTSIAAGVDTSLNKPIKASLPPAVEAITQLRCVLINQRKQYETIKGTYVQTTSAKRNLIHYAVLCWLEAGHKVTTTPEGEFAWFLKHLNAAATGKEPSSVTTQLMMAKEMVDDPAYPRPNQGDL